MRWRKGARWGLVSTTGVLTGFGHGFAAFAVSALLKPIALDLDTGRGGISTAIGLGRLASGLASPAVGRMTDLWGPRIIVTGGMLLSALGLFLLGFIRSEFELYIAWSLVFSVGVAVGFTVALDKLVVSSVSANRGMALAIRFSVAAIVTTLVVPLVTASIEVFGWRQTCLLWAIMLLLLIPIPLIWFRAERLNPATPERSLSADIALAELPDARGVRWALRQPAFWVIAAALTAQASVTTGLSIHLLPMMTDFGLDPVVAGTLFGGMILLTIPVRLLAGHLADRIAPRMLPYLLGWLLVLEGMAIGSFALAPGFATMLVVIGSLGIAAGAPMVLVLVLCNELFGQRSFGAVQGSLMMIQVPGTMLAPIVAGYVHDISGSYTGVIVGFGIMLVLGGSLLSFVKQT